MYLWITITLIFILSIWECKRIIKGNISLTGERNINQIATGMTPRERMYMSIAKIFLLAIHISLSLFVSGIIFSLFAIIIVIALLLLPKILILLILVYRASGIHNNKQGDS